MNTTMRTVVFALSFVAAAFFAGGACAEDTPSPLCKSSGEKECYERSNTPGNWILQQADGGAAEGPFVNGKPYGHWIERHANGDVYKGPFVNGKRHGHWVIQYANGFVAEGPIVNGKRLGRWVHRLGHGLVYEGLYVNDKRHGHWVFRYADGSERIVIWENGKLKPAQ